MTKKPKPSTATDPPFAIPNWPDMNAKPWKLDRIKPYPNNPRTHPEAQIALLADMMKRWGPDQPIVVDEKGFILKGHGRIEAARLAGFEEFPVVQRLGLPDAEKRAMRIADNQVALLSDWHRDKMRSELITLKAEEYPLDILGFGALELTNFMVPDLVVPKDPEHVPEVPKKPIIKLGDAWHMGEHRLICADATDAESWARLFGRERAAMVFTDPPYGVSYQAQSGNFGVIEGDKKRSDDLFKMLTKSFRGLAKYTTKDAGFYIWHASETRDEFAQAMAAVGLVERQYLIWAKPSIALGHADYQWGHEPCFYASHVERSPAFYGDRAQSTIWRVAMVSANDAAVTIGGGVQIVDGNGASLFIQSKAPKAKKLREFRVGQDRPAIHLSGAEGGTGTVWEVSRDQNYVHPTQKPVELATLAINNSSRRGEIVVDCFGGSGATLIGAELTGRRAFVMEMDPQYAEVIVRRWQELTGNLATLESGETLEEVAKSRSSKAGSAYRRTRDQGFRPASI